MDSRDSKTAIEPAMTASKESNNGSQVFESGELVNASGHAQELERNFSLLNICAVGITTGNTWVAIGGSVVSNFHFHEQEEVLSDKSVDYRDLQWRSPRSYL